MRSGLPHFTKVLWPLFKRTGFLFALAVVLLPALEVKAGASCGHYVRRMGAGFKPGQPAEKLSRLKLEEVSLSDKAAESSASSFEPTLTAAPCHCTGPECQGMPPASAPVTPALPSAQGVQEWAVVLSEKPVIVKSLGPWDRDSLSARPLAGYRTLPDRPPNG